MVNETALQECERLERVYKERWGREVDLSLLPRTVTQEMLCLILRRIVDTGESSLVGYDKIKDITHNYYKNIDWTIHYKDGDLFCEKCPFCGRDVKITYVGTYNQSSVIWCETDFCLRIATRGL